MIRPFIYILLLAATVMFYKTFYYDYKKKEIPTEANASIKTPEVTQTEPAKAGLQSKTEMPVDRLGDSISDSLKDKIQVK